MNLLLLFSALLSALTGVGSAARAPAAAQTVSAQVTAAAAAAQVAAVRIAQRPQQAVAALRAVAGGLALPALRLQVTPLYASRRRE